MGVTSAMEKVEKAPPPLSEKELEEVRTPKLTRPHTHFSRGTHALTQPQYRSYYTHGIIVMSSHISGGVIQS